MLGCGIVVRSPFPSDADSAVMVLKKKRIHRTGVPRIPFGRCVLVAIFCS